MKDENELEFGSRFFSDMRITPGVRASLNYHLEELRLVFRKAKQKNGFGLSFNLSRHRPMAWSLPLDLSHLSLQNYWNNSVFARSDAGHK